MTTDAPLSIRDIVLAQFPGRVNITFAEAATAIGISPKTAYNLRSLGKFPLPVQKAAGGQSKAGANVVSLMDVIAFLEGERQRAIDEQRDREKIDAEPIRRPKAPTKRKTGRPTRAEAEKRAKGP